LAAFFILSKEASMDQRITKFAHSLITYSVSLQKGEKLLIEVTDGGIPLAKALVAEAYKVGGVPFVTVKNSSLQRELLLGCSKEQMEMAGAYEAGRMKNMDAYIAVRAGFNAGEMADVPNEKMGLFEKYWSNPVHGDIRVPHTKWCVMRYPGPAIAQAANMSTEAFTDFYFDVCTLDYAKMDKAMNPLQELMNKTDKVHLVGPGTDLSFSIKNIGAIKCSGLRNIPDGEVYTAPVRESINGTLHYNVPAVFQGRTYENIAFTFKNGKIIKAESNATESMNRVLDTDAGSRYIGEFSLGLNPYILNPMKDTLFDEKIAGSFHMTPGRCYDEAPNGNHSAIHWDLVCVQRPEYGGGEIYFDDVLIRKDGRFVVPALAGLNPENLK
jgi:aminopeptidase